MIRSMSLVLFLLIFVQPATAQLFPGDDGAQIDQVNTDPELKPAVSLAAVNTDPVLKPSELGAVLSLIETLKFAGNDIQVLVKQVKGVDYLVVMQKGVALKSFAIECKDCLIEFEY